MRLKDFKTLFCRKMASSSSSQHEHEPILPIIDYELGPIVENPFIHELNEISYIPDPEAQQALRRKRARRDRDPCADWIPIPKPAQAPVPSQFPPVPPPRTRCMWLSMDSKMDVYRAYPESFPEDSPLWAAAYILKVIYNIRQRYLSHNYYIGQTGNVRRRLCDPEIGHSQHYDEVLLLLRSSSAEFDRKVESLVIRNRENSLDPEDKARLRKLCPESIHLVGDLHMDNESDTRGAVWKAQGESHYLYLCIRYMPGGCLRRRNFRNFSTAPAATQFFPFLHDR